MQDRVRIGSVWSNLYGAGGGNRMLSFARGFDRERFELIVIAVANGDLERTAQYGSTRKRFIEAGIEVVSLNAPVWSEALSELHPRAVAEGAGRFVVLARRLAKLIERHRLDVLDLNGDPSLGLGVCVGKLTNLPTVLTVFDNLFWDRPLWRTFGRYLMSQVDVLLTDSEQRSSMLQRWLPGARRPRVIRNGIDEARSAHGRLKMRSRLGLSTSPDVTVIGQVSRLMSSKGQHIVIEAMPQVLRRFPNAFLLLCGYPAPRNKTDFVAELRRKARDFGVAERLRIVSYPGDIADVWAAIDVHVHASLRDSSPIAVIEGMSLGKPAVVTAEGGIVELVTHQETGLVVRPGDAKALGDALIRLLSDEKTAAKFGAAARARYLARHQRQPMVRELERVFGQLVRGREHERGRLGTPWLNPS